MHHVGAFEAKTHLSALLDRVEKGEEIVITRHGRPVARMVPAQARDQAAIDAAAARIKARRGVIQASVDEVISWKNEGRA